ncbi:MAG: 2-oxo acid dehydrogenase subunit E2, partial [Deltaproteobacteria bacterium]|nr:2-oxo acid dehydrogenase subunit E2 [Deltaproteobacteria bacterium]
MSVNITMPKWGLTMKTGKLTKWLKNEGEAVHKGEQFFEVETEKITNYVEATCDGIVFQIVVPAGTTVPVGTVVAVVAAPGEQPERVAGGQAAAAVEAGPAATAKTKAAAPAQEKKFVPASPAAR